MFDLASEPTLLLRLLFEILYPTLYYVSRGFGLILVVSASLRVSTVPISIFMDVTFPQLAVGCPVKLAANVGCYCCKPYGDFIFFSSSLI